MRTSMKQEMINELLLNGEVIRYVDSDYRLIRPSDSTFASGYGETDESFPSDATKLVLLDENDIDWFIFATDTGTGRKYEKYFRLTGTHKHININDIDIAIVEDAMAETTEIVDNTLLSRFTTKVLTGTKIVKSTIKVDSNTGIIDKEITTVVPICDTREIIRRIDDDACFNELSEDTKYSIGLFNNRNWFECTKSLEARKRNYELSHDTRKLKHLVGYLRDCKSNKRLLAIVDIIKKEKDSLSNTSIKILRNEYTQTKWRFRQYYMNTGKEFTYRNEADCKVVYGSFS